MFLYNFYILWSIGAGLPLVTDWKNGIDERETGGILQVNMTCDKVSRNSGDSTFTQLKFIELKH